MKVTERVNETHCTYGVWTVLWKFAGKCLTMGLPNGTLKVLQSLCLITWFIRIFQQALQKYTQEYFPAVVTTFKGQREGRILKPKKKVNLKGEVKCNIFHLFAKF